MTHIDSQPEMEKVEEKEVEEKEVEEDIISIISFDSYDSEATISECADTIPAQDCTITECIQLPDMISQQVVISRSSSPNSWILDSITDSDSIAAEEASNELDSMCSVTNEIQESELQEKLCQPIQLQQLFDIVVSDGNGEKEQENKEKDNSSDPLPILQKDLDTLVKNQNDSTPIKPYITDVFADINEYESDTEPLPTVENDTSLEITNLIHYIYDKLTSKLYDTRHEKNQSPPVVHRPVTRSMTSKVQECNQSNARSSSKQVKVRPNTRTTKNKVCKNKSKVQEKVTPFTMVLRNRTK